MAGCKPEYLPVVISAIRGLAHPDFNAYGMQATTNPVAVLVVVNGPITEELGLNGKGNCLGQGFRGQRHCGAGGPPVHDQYRWWRPTDDGQGDPGPTGEVRHVHRRERGGVPVGSLPCRARL